VVNTTKTEGVKLKKIGASSIRILKKKQRKGAPTNEENNIAETVKMQTTSGGKGSQERN